MKNFYDDGRSARADNFTNSIKLVGIILLIALLGKYLIVSGFLFKDSLNGPGYTMASPIGWEKVDKELTKQLEDDVTTVVAYITPEKDPITEIPHAQIAVYSVSLPRSMWMEDEFPTILSSIKRSNLKLIKTGEIKINEQLFKWVLVDNVQDDVVSMQFFHISESKMFYKLIYSASAKYFGQYRQTFDEVKETFNLKFAL